MTADARHADVTHALDWSEHEALRRGALALAAQMNDWLHGSRLDDATVGAKSDLVEWCRSARDILEQVARG